MTRPHLAFEWDQLAKAAVRLHADAAPGCEAGVRDGRISEARADEILRPLAAIACEWRQAQAVRAGERPGAVDATATRAERIEAMTSAVASASRKVARARVALLQALRLAGKHEIIAAIEADVMTRPCVWEEWKARRLNHPEIPLLFTAERDLWEAEAILWHERETSGPLSLARLNAEMRGASPISEAA